MLDAVVSRELLVAIFVRDSPNQLRAGVAVVRGDRVERAGVRIPWAAVVERAAGIAVAVDEDAEIWITDRTGRGGVVKVDGLAETLRRHSW